jgi:hypothetical protein
MKRMLRYFTAANKVFSIACLNTFLGKAPGCIIGVPYIGINKNEGIL